jgi:hypothetical protein
MAQEVVVDAIRENATVFGIPESSTEVSPPWICPTCKVLYGLFIAGECLPADGAASIAALDRALREECGKSHPSTHLRSVNGQPAVIL